MAVLFSAVIKFPSMSYFILFKESDFEIVVVICCDIHFYSLASLEIHVFSQAVMRYVLVMLYKILVFWVDTW
jgi:phage gp36-like protein